MFVAVEQSLPTNVHSQIISLYQVSVVNGEFDSVTAVESLTFHVRSLYFPY